jgi:hypothetical protein
MPKKRSERSTKVTRRARSRKPDPERAARTVLGTLDPSLLKASPRSKLLEACRLLGLRGISRLRKEEIVDRLLHALHPSEIPVESQAEIEAKPPVTSELAPVEHAARSRAEFQAHKFDLTKERGAPGEASGEPSREPSLPPFIPWSYGRERVRALAVDPERLYVYWEVTDEARERARAKLGAGASTAWLSLRVYDTTGRLFDGTNAHSYFDHRVENGSRQWFFDIGKPGSEAFVEIGMKSHEGYFVRIARSGRVSFPRRSPAPYREPQWLTVRALSEPPVITTRRAEGQLGPAARRRARVAPVPMAESVRVSPEAPIPVEPPPTEPRAVEVREEREIERRWEAPVTTHRWEAGPFTEAVDLPGAVRETYSGETSTFEVDGRTHVVFGPWQVVVRGLGAFEKRQVLSRWMVYRSWAVEIGGEGPPGALRASPMLGSSALVGASEKRLRGGSELRLGGASELYYRGASERRLGGASERLYRGASERLLRGASERRYLAASEKLLRGASERRPLRPSGQR